jgi:hypothetical protein
MSRLMLTRNEHYASEGGDVQSYPRAGFCSDGRFLRSWQQIRKVEPFV